MKENQERRKGAHRIKWSSHKENKNGGEKKIQSLHHTTGGSVFKGG